MTALRLEGVVGRDLRPLTAEFPAGMHVVKLHDDVGLAEIFALLDGTRTPRRGKITLRQRKLDRDPELRSHVGSLWPVEEFDGSLTAERYLRRLGFSATRLESIRSIGESLEEPTLLDTPFEPATPARHRRLALAIALSVAEPYLLLFHEPFAELNRPAQSFLLERLLVQSRSIPVILFTASTPLAEQLGGATLEFRNGYFRRVSPTKPEWHLVRVTGVGLRTLNGELSKRPSIRSLRFVAEPLGQEVLWIETRDPRQISLDIVRVTQTLEIRVHSLQTTAVAP